MNTGELLTVIRWVGGLAYREMGFGLWLWVITGRGQESVAAWRRSPQVRLTARHG
jgi:hypothetical protein